MMVKTVLILITLLLFSGCVQDGDDFISMIDSNSFAEQVELLPTLLNPEIVEDLFNTTNNDFPNPRNMYDYILTRYVIALIETNNEQLLRENIVDILQRFNAHIHSGDLLILITREYNDMVEIILPEIIHSYENMCERNFRERLLWIRNIQVIYYVNGDIENANAMDEEFHFFLQEMQIANEYLMQYEEGIIEFSEIPWRYLIEVERILSIPQSWTTPKRDTTPPTHFAMDFLLSGIGLLTP